MISARLLIIIDKLRNVKMSLYTRHHVGDKMWTFILCTDWQAIDDDGCGVRTVGINYSFLTCKRNCNWQLDRNSFKSREKILQFWFWLTAISVLEQCEIDQDKQLTISRITWWRLFCLYASRFALNTWSNRHVKNFNLTLNMFMYVQSTRKWWRRTLTRSFGFSFR